MSNKQEAGFTLVELAIVMIVVGLLLGGVLKGQELIHNARINTYATDFHKYKTAHFAFMDRYGFFAGDMPRNLAAQRIPNCTAVNDCSDVGGFNAAFGDGNVGAMWGVPGQSGPVNGYNQSSIESFLYWKDLSLSGFITNVDGNITLTGNVTNTSNTELAYPAGSYGGNGTSGWQNARGQPVWFMFTVINTSNFSSESNRKRRIARHYRGKVYALSRTPLLASESGSITFTPTFARDIDQKIDDGLPNTGMVLGNNTSVTSCKTGTAPTAQYFVGMTGLNSLCNILILID